MPMRLLLAPNGNDQPSSSCCLPVGWQRPGQVDAHDGPVHGVGQRRGGSGAPRARPGLDAHRRRRRLTHSEESHRHLGALGAEPRILAEDAEAAALAVEQILLELQPDVAESVGRVVGVGDALFAANRARGGVQRGADHVVGALLPVGAAGSATAGAYLVRRRQLEPAECQLGVPGRRTGRDALGPDLGGYQRERKTGVTQAHGTSPRPNRRERRLNAGSPAGPSDGRQQQRAGVSGPGLGW